jgi:hypothetical protein
MRPRDERIEELTAALDDARTRSERKVAAAALADTRGREHALDVLTAVLGEVPEHVIARVVASLSRLVMTHRGRYVRDLDDRPDCRDSSTTSAPTRR